MFRLRNRLLPLLCAASSPSSPIHLRACRHLLSTSTSIAIVPVPFSLEDYLVSSCGFAPAQAREVSKKLSHELLSYGSRRSLDELSFSRLNSASNPDAILTLLSSAGLSRADIAVVVSADPLLLHAYANKIASRLLALRDHVGLSTPQIARFLLYASRSLCRYDVAPKVEFFISFFGSFDRILMVAKRNWSLFNATLEKIIKPNIALFHQCGVPDIAKVCLHNPWVLAFKPERVKEFLLWAEELGVPPTFGMFRHAVAVTSGLSKEKDAVELEFLRNTLGFSESEVSIAVSKKPQVLELSDDNIGCKIEFLINEAALEPQYIVERPIVLTYSPEKQLVPRHYAMKVLQEKGLLSTNIYTVTKLGEEAFKLKYIDYHKDNVPELADAYAAALDGIVPSKV